MIQLFSILPLESNFIYYNNLYHLQLARSYYVYQQMLIYNFFFLDPLKMELKYVRYISFLYLVIAVYSFTPPYAGNGPCPNLCLQDCPLLHLSSLRVSLYDFKNKVCSIVIVMRIFSTLVV